MVPHEIDRSGNCFTCKAAANEQQILECYDCETRYHNECENNVVYSNKSFVKSFKALKNNNNFIFVCDHCKTRRENLGASSMKDQLAEVVSAIASLTKEVADMKTAQPPQQVEGIQKQQQPLPPPSNQQKLPQPQQHQQGNGFSNESNSAWNNPVRVDEMKRQMKVSVRIKSNTVENAVDMNKVKEIVTSNGVQISKATVDRTKGDVYIDFPSEENRDQLITLLSEEPVSVVSLKQKCPTISIRGIGNYVSENDLVEKIKSQNPLIKEKLEKGSEFTVIYTKEHARKFEDRRRAPKTDDSGTMEFQVVARVSDDIRAVIKSNNDKVYIGFTAHHVVDRFYIKNCGKCHKLGHYHAECTSKPSCGYCWAEDHCSAQCPVMDAKDITKYKCINCHEANRECDGHSSHWQKCPTYLEAQKKMITTIPYYAKNLK